jgi:hypothetical protein
MIAETELEERLSDLERRVSALEGTHAVPVISAPNSTERPPSPREFLLSKTGADSLNDKVVVAGYYIEHYEGKDSFDHDDIARFLVTAKERPPANRRDVIYQNVKHGAIREVGPRAKGRTARNRWCLTNTGIAMVESNFAEAK